MKKLLVFILFISSLLAFSGNLSAQTINRGALAGEHASDDGVLIAYPNPARDFLVVKSKNPAVFIKSVTFYSILGMQVAEYKINTVMEEIRLDKLKPGKYLMRYTMSDSTQKITQIVKQ